MSGLEKDEANLNRTPKSARPDPERALFGVRLRFVHGKLSAGPEKISTSGLEISRFSDLEISRSENLEISSPDVEIFSGPADNFP